MATIVTRAGKGSPLTHDEVDANFNNLNTDKIETETDPTVPAHVKSITTGEKANWNTAYSWGDHSLVGYLTTETDPVFSAWDRSTGISITESQISDFGTYEPAFAKNTAFNKNFGTTAGTVAQGNDSRIINGQTAYSWGNHATAGYLTNLRASTSVLTANTTAVAFRAYVLNGTLTLTMPASPTVGDWVEVEVFSGVPIIGRNGQNIMGLAEDLTLDSQYAGFKLIYTGATQGWVIF